MQKEQPNTDEHMEEAKTHNAGKTKLSKYTKTEEYQAQINKLHKQKTATWTCVSNKIKRQIGYVMIN